ncbi:FAD-dependent monooxygenase [Aliidiomarina taiwanensis]|nr:FAD-dependent monooxygenase [Aliidiomarina taiwanensis]
MTDITTSALIVGGGMVGASLAIGLARQGKQVVVLDPKFIHQWDKNSEYDLRISAVTHDNIELLEQLGVWSRIQDCRLYPFHQLAVSDSPEHWLELGDANGSKPLGYMIENKVMQHALFLEMTAYDSIQCLETSLEHLCPGSQQATTVDGHIIRFDLVFGCDGAHSQVRSQSGIGVAGRDYGQRCLLSIVETEQQVPARTWELFKDREIHALLPLANKYACCILYGSSDQVAAWQASKESMAGELKERFTPYIGAFKVQNYASFPLIRQSALRYVQCPTVLLGDAAHSIHPMAGQGVNLGFRDVKALLEAVQSQALTPTTERAAALTRFQRMRRIDNETMAHAMDVIGWGFHAEKQPVPVLRRALLKGLQAFAPGRSIMTAYASGVWKL